MMARMTPPVRLNCTRFRALVRSFFGGCVVRNISVGAARMTIKVA